MENAKQGHNIVVGNIHRGLGRFFELVHQIGLPGAIIYGVQVRLYSLLRRVGLHPRRLFSMRTRNASYPLYARDSSSDLEVFEQIFVKKEYSPLDDIENAKVIVDCGAYVGYSTAYFLTRFPQARLFAVEADRENFLLGQRNLALYGDRVTLLHSAIWRRPGGLILVRGKYRDGQQWATQVRECSERETADVPAIDLLTLLDRAKLPQVDLLKMDIEGAEKVVFDENCQSWMDRVRNIAIELHDEECRSVFFGALSPYHFDLLRSGELFICRNLRRKSRGALPH